MPRQPKKTDNRGPNKTVPRQFRLGDETLDHLDEIAAFLVDDDPDHKPVSRAEAIRWAARKIITEIRNNSNDSA